MNDAIDELLAGKDDIFFSNLVLATQALSSSAILLDPKTAREIVNQALAFVVDSRHHREIIERVLEALINTYDPVIQRQLFDRFVRTCQSGQPAFVVLEHLAPFLTTEQCRILLGVTLSPYLGRADNLRLINLIPVTNSADVAFEMLGLLDEPGISTDVKNLALSRVVTSGHRSLIEPLLDLLQDEVIPLGLRENIALNLRNVEDEEVNAVLRGLLNDPLYEFQLKPAVAVALLNQGERKIVRFMLQLLHAPDVARRSKQFIVTTLLRLREDKVTLELCRMLLDPALHNENKEQIIAELPNLINNPEMLAEISNLTNGLPGFLHDIIYRTLYQIAQTLRVRLYLDDSRQPYRFYTKPLPESSLVTAGRE